MGLVSGDSGPLLLKETLDVPRIMLWIIVLHQAMTIRVVSADKKEKCLSQNCRITFMMPSKLTMSVAPLQLIPAQICTLVGCLGL